MFVTCNLMKMDKNVLLYLILGILCSCGKKEPKIGFLLPSHLQKRYVKERALFDQKVKELGGSVVFMEAGNNDVLQIKQATDLVNQGIDVLVINSVNTFTAAAIVRAAHAKGIPVIAYDRLIQNSDPDYFLSFDNVEVGTLMAAYVTKLKPEGKYVLLGGDKGDQNALLVKSGQQKVLDPYIKAGKISVIYDTYVEDWSGPNAKQEVRQFMKLSMNKPDVILSSNDGMATSVIDLLREEGLNKQILITGQDAEIDACRNIVKGDQVMTVYKSLVNLAYKAAEMSVKIAKGEKISDKYVLINNGRIDVPSILLTPKIVDKTNIRTTIIADGFFTESEIYN